MTIWASGTSESQVALSTEGGWLCDCHAPPMQPQHDVILGSSRGWGGREGGTAWLAPQSGTRS